MAKNKMWIMYHQKDVEKNSWFIDTFITKAKEYDIEMKLVTVEEYEAALIAESDAIDAVVARMINPKISYELEKKGVRVFNHAKVSEICNNKAECIRIVKSLGIRCIPTITAVKDSSGFLSFDKSCLAQSELKTVVDYITENNKLPAFEDYIIKSVSGHGGKEVMTLAEYVREYGEQLKVNSLFGMQEQNAAKYYSDYFIIQPLIKTNGRDLRVYIIGNNIIKAILRQGQSSFKSNYSLGGSVSVYELNSSQRNIVQTIAEAFDFDYAGIDFLLDDNDEFIFNEIEDVVGARMLSACTDIDYISMYIEHIIYSLDIENIIIT